MNDCRLCQRAIGRILILEQDKLLRGLSFILIGMTVLFAVVLLSARFVLLPQLDANPQKVASLLQKELGLPVTIDEMKTGWNGWNPQLTVHHLRIYEKPVITDAALEEAHVDLPKVTMLVSWRSLFHWDVRLRFLRIEAPTLTMRRDAAGNIFIGGIPLAASQKSEENATQFAAWLQRQHAIEIVRGTLNWKDEYRNAPLLTMQNFGLRGEKELNRYRIAFRGVFDTDTQARLDIRGETTKDASRWYARFEQVDFSLLSQWFDLPIAVERGSGNAQSWLSIVNQRITDFTLDVALHDARAHLAPNSSDPIPLLNVQQANGRFTGLRQDNRYTLAAHNFSFIDENGTMFPSANIQLSMQLSPDTPEENAPSDLLSLLSRASQTRLDFDRLRLAPLVKLFASIPAWDAQQALLAKLQPHGILENGTLYWESGENPSLHGTAALVGFTLNPYQNYPGLDNIDAHISFDDAGGTLILNGVDAAVEFPEIFIEKIPLQKLDGKLQWQKNGGKITNINIDHLRFANDNVDITLGGTWQANDAAGIADLTASVHRAEATHVYRYIPLIVDSDIRDWLQTSLLAGQADQGKVILRGDLAKFPFSDGDENAGVFSVEAQAHHVLMRYAPDWPPINDLEAKLLFHNESMTIEAQQGEILEAHMLPVRAVIPDLGADLPHLFVDGKTQGDLDIYFRFLEESPVGTAINHLLQDARGNGMGLLSLSLDIPLSVDDPNHSKVNGELALSQNTLMIPDVPLLSQIRGVVSFTEDSIRADDLSFAALGGTGKVVLYNSEGSVAIKGTGMASMARIRENYPFFLAEHFRGEIPWRFHLKANIDKKNADWLLESSLRGVTIDLPEPFAKTSQQETSLRIVRSILDQSDNEEIWRIDYQLPQVSTMQVVAQRERDHSDAPWITTRTSIYSGEPVSMLPLPKNKGIYVNGSLPQIDLDPWLALLDTLPKNHGETVALSRADFSTNALTAFGQTLHRVKLSVTPDETSLLCGEFNNYCLKINIDSDELAGEIEWKNAKAGETENDHIQARLSKLVLPETDDDSHDGSALNDRAIAIKRDSGNSWTELDVDVAKLIYRGRDVGHMKILAKPQGADWRIERIYLVNDAGQFDANGWWHTTLAKQKTEMRIAVAINDMQKFLGYFGIPEGFVASATQISGVLSWANAPTDFDLETLDGTLAVSVERGHFSKIEPGIGRLLGVLSLQALPRRITLDFRDVFSEGFAFDTIRGNTTINGGIMTTDDLLLDGPAAKVKFSGNIDLAKETQQLDVLVRPSMIEGVSVGAAALLMSTPVSAAAVGLSALVGQMILDDPIGKMFSYEYHIEGSWSDPIVEKKNVVRNGIAHEP
ncbi:MAG: TIGR02099 family protein [Burkholderiales bacterium]|jgi:uncharacterized protein (TIGR02099 family)|nr:TIGR02099 family protein [Burkholderiales bacterium]